MKERTPQGETLTALILETFRLNGALLAAGNEITKPHDMTSARWQVMGAIDLTGQPITVSEIARRMGLTRQAVQRIVNDLEQLGMVSLEPNPDHKTASLIAITEQGQKVMNEINKAQVEWVNDLAKNLPEKELQKAFKTLETIRETLNQNMKEK